MQSLVTEIEAIKLFIKEQLYLPKKFVLEINSNTDTVDSAITENTEFLRKHNEFLSLENTSKNIIIKLLAENQNHLDNFQEINSSKQFKTTSCRFRRNHYKPKLKGVLYGNLSDSLYHANNKNESDSSSNTKVLLTENNSPTTW